MHVWRLLSLWRGALDCLNAARRGCAVQLLDLPPLGRRLGLYHPRCGDARCATPSRFAPDPLPLGGWAYWFLLVQPLRCDHPLRKRRFRP